MLHCSTSIVNFPYCDVGVEFPECLDQVHVSVGDDVELHGGAVLSGHARGYAHDVLVIHLHHAAEGRLHGTAQEHTTSQLVMTVSGGLDKGGSVT